MQHLLVVAAHSQCAGRHTRPRGADQGRQLPINGPTELIHRDPLVLPLVLDQGRLWVFASADPSGSKTSLRLSSPHNTPRASKDRYLKTFPFPTKDLRVSK